MIDNNTIRVKVTGDYACFTRPDLKVERMSYPCMTPAAARGVLDSILWKPEFRWHIKKIYVLKPIKFASIKRNEISDKQRQKPIVVEDSRAQRNSIVLRDVAYVIEASISQPVLDLRNPPQKYAAMFTRRIEKGQCYRRPFLGCREFPAEFFPVPDVITAIAEDIPIGSMLLDIYFDNKCTPQPIFFFDVAIKRGVLDCEVAYSRMLPSSHIRPERDKEVSAVLYEFKKIEEMEAERL